ncbi:MAG: N-acetyltransferase [Gammaproteobacteria bacterium]|nr:N-acetyltransferase [Gammaproteobacteria bacterium]
MNLIIRNEIKSDYKIVEEMTREAFWNLHMPGCDEHYVVHLMRDHPDFVPEMAYVAEVDNKIVGNIMYTKSFVLDENNNRIDTLTFGPICVLPEYQRQGIGTSLINHTKKIAIQNKTKAIIILGHPHNYCKHGFKNCIDYGISDSDGRYPYGQLVLELEKSVFEGKAWKFHFSSVYELDENRVSEFDKQFCRKEKEYKYSQEEYRIAVRAYLENPQ